MRSSLSYSVEPGQSLGFCVCGRTGVGIEGVRSGDYGKRFEKIQL